MMAGCLRLHARCCAWRRSRIASGVLPGVARRLLWSVSACKMESSLSVCFGSERVSASESQLSAVSEDRG